MKEKTKLKPSELNFFSSYVSPKAMKYLTEIMHSSMLSEGEYVVNFEKKLEKHFRLPEGSVVTTNSGTSALHLALATLEIGEGDEVILPAQTFVATGLAVLYAGAKPVFCDIGLDGNISVKEIAKKITPKTKAVIAVNWVGYPCDLYGIRDVTRNFGIKIIVDAAQSLGHGMGGDITCLSFQATKHLTTGDGGAVVCYNKRDADEAKNLRWFGINKEKNIPDILGERVYDLVRIGYKYHMNNVAAAIGIANLDGIDERQKHREKIAEIYSKNAVGRQIHSYGAFWAYPIWVDDVVGFSTFCHQNQIPVSVIHKGIDRNSLFGGIDNSLVNQRLWEKHVVHLPIHHDISEEDAYDICERMKKYV